MGGGLAFSGVAGIVRGMTQAVLSELLQLPKPQRLAVAERLWLSVADEASTLQALRKLLEMGVGNVLITRGSEGAVFGNRTETIFSPSIFCPKVIDPTAAGDSFVGAFCTAVCMGAGHREALTFANYTAHITVSHMGAQPSLPILARVLERMRADGLDVSRYEAYC